jgi:hypothetical protein
MDRLSSLFNRRLPRRESHWLAGLILICTTMAQSRKKSKRGVAVVELAVTLPVILLIAFATIEICSGYYLRQTLKISAYQGCRMGITPAGSGELVRSQCELLLKERGVKNYTIALSKEPETLAENEIFTVTVSAPFSDNIPMSGWIMKSRVVQCSVAMLSER